jgi:phage gp36-like protein
MAYCTDTDISSEFKDITFSASTTITDTEVDGYIDQASSLIDSYLIAKYQVPITGSASLLFMKMICIWLVKSRILSILSVKTPLDKTKQDPDGQKLYDQAIELLKKLKSGAIQLTDAVASTSDDGLTSYLMNRDVEFQFQMESDSW